MGTLTIVDGKEDINWELMQKLMSEDDVTMTWEKFLELTPELNNIDWSKLKGIHR